MKSSKPLLHSWRDWLTIYLGGLCFGIADLMPGISSGAVAFILGIYEKLLNGIRSFNLTALSALVHLRFRDFFSTVAWEFFLALGLGMATTLIILAPVINDFLHHPTYRTLLFALFTGLVLGAAHFCTRQVRTWHWSYALLFVIAGAITLSITLPRGSPKNGGVQYEVVLERHLVSPAALEIPLANYNRSTQTLTRISESTLSDMLAKGLVEKNTPARRLSDSQTRQVSDFVDGKRLLGIDWWLFGCGVLGVCAMLLPGISGSYMLTILGAYPIAIAALADFIQSLKQMSFDVDALGILTTIFTGMLVGAAVLSRLLSWLLIHHHDRTIVVLTGFMLGALPAVWPFWSFEYLLSPLRPDKAPQLNVVEPLAPDFSKGILWAALLCTLAGVFVVLALEKLRASKKRDVR